VGFEKSTASGIEFGFDERDQAELMSAFFKTEHYQMVLKSGDLERCFKDLVYHLEEPRVGQSYPNFYAAKLASKFVKVVLSGAGGDELFAGYPWRYYAKPGASTFQEYIDHYYNYWQRLLPNKEIHKVFKPIEQDVKNVWTRDILEGVFSDTTSSNMDQRELINKSLYFEAKTFMHGLLIVEDKLSMAHGLEARLPFLDNDLVDFAVKCPIEFKLDNIGKSPRIDENVPNKKIQYYEKTKEGKKILRDAMTSFMPKEILERPKQGFSAPDARWFRGQSIDFVRKKLYRNDANIFAFMDRKSVLELVDQHLNGVQNRRLLIWSLMYFEEWIEQNL
jgi:asparagine synthase (glutamine-hydrolysing)